VLALRHHFLALEFGHTAIILENKQADYRRQADVFATLVGDRRDEI
jgi:hypothetical protein